MSKIKCEHDLEKFKRNLLNDPVILQFNKQLGLISMNATIKKIVGDEFFYDDKTSELIYKTQKLMDDYIKYKYDQFFEGYEFYYGNTMDLIKKGTI